MNIAIFASAFHPSLGGVEELCRQLALAYRRRGFDAIVITQRWPRDLPAYEDFEGIPLYRLPFRVPEGDLKAQVSYRLTHSKIVEEMLAILRKHKIELLHVQCVSHNALYARIAQQKLGLPLVLTTQGERTMDATGVFQTSALMNRILREGLENADYITGCSQNTLDDMEHYFGEPFGKRASVVYNGIALADFEGVIPYAHPRPYILGIGRHVPQKGFDVLLEAFQKAELSEYDLILAGDGAERAALESRAKAAGLADRVIFPGRADRVKAVSLFKGCTFFVLPSRMEPQGIVNLEAMAAGKAVIASRTGGVPEIVLENETGLLVPPGEVTPLAHALRTLAEDDTLRQKLGDAGRVRAEHFDWKAIADQYVAVYSQILKSRLRDSTH